MAEKTKPTAENVQSLDELLSMDIQEIKSATPAGGGRGKRSSWGNLNDDAKKLIHKKIMINLKKAAEFKVGQIDEVQFFVISDVPTNEKTPVIKRGQKVSFAKDGVTIVAPVIGFTQTGTGKKISYMEGETKIEFPVSGMSVCTPEGDKAILKCNLNPKIEEPAG